MFVVEFAQDGYLKTAPYLFKHKIDAVKYARQLMENSKREFVVLDDYDDSSLEIVPYRIGTGFALMQNADTQHVYQLNHAVVKKFEITTFDRLKDETPVLV